MHLPFATWLGNLLTVGTPLLMPSRPQGLVLHNSDGQYGKGVNGPLRSDGSRISTSGPSQTGPGRTCAWPPTAAPR